MSWPEIREQLVQLFEGLAIEDPPATLKHVYEFPPANIEDDPCIVIYPPKRLPVTRGYGARTVHYTVSCLLLLQDEDALTAAKMIDAFAEKVLDVFDEATAIKGVGNAWLISQHIEAPRGALTYSGKGFVGFDCIVVIGDTVTKELRP